MEKATMNCNINVVKDMYQHALKQRVKAFTENNVEKQCYYNGVCKAIELLTTSDDFEFIRDEKSGE